jgi:hypothetical protein
MLNFRRLGWGTKPNITEGALPNLRKSELFVQALIRLKQLHYDELFPVCQYVFDVKVPRFQVQRSGFFRWSARLVPRSPAALIITGWPKAGLDIASRVILHRIRSCSRNHLTAEIAASGRYRACGPEGERRESYHRQSLRTQRALRWTKLFLFRSDWTLAVRGAARKFRKKPQEIKKRPGRFRTPDPPAAEHLEPKPLNAEPMNLWTLYPWTRLGRTSFWTSEPFNFFLNQFNRIWQI